LVLLTARYVKVRICEINLQLTSNNYQKNYPAAAKIASEAFYVDDLITGTVDVDSALAL
jgi:hypothetical protein